MVSQASDAPQRRKRRPENSATDALRASTWYWAIRERDPLFQSSYAIEKYMAQIKGTFEEGQWINSGLWRQYRNGTTVPSDPTANAIELLYPITKIWLSLPLWELSGPLPSQERINELMSMLRNDVVRLYLDIRWHMAALSKNRANLRRLFGSLDKIGDIEALSACIALCRMAEHDNSVRDLYYATIGATRIFRRLAAFGPFFYVASNLNQHWRETVYRRELFESWGPIQMHTEEGTIAINQDLDEYFSIERLDEVRYMYNDILFLLEDTVSVENNPALCRACLYIANQYSTVKAYSELSNHYLSELAEDPSTASSLPFCQYLIKRLRSFPFTASAVDWSITAK